MLDLFATRGVAELGTYCERVVTGSWQEPFNTFSALAFIVAGLMGLSLCAKVAKTDFLRIVMALCILATGGTSFILHKDGIPLPLIYDFLPVLLFDICAAWAIMARAFNANGSTNIILTSVIVGSSIAITPIAIKYGFSFNGIEHLGFICWLLLLSILLFTKGNLNSGATLTLASLVLLLAIWLKNIDISQCVNYQHGTHWLWHIAGACGSYFIVRGIPLLADKNYEVETRI